MRRGSTIGVLSTRRRVARIAAVAIDRLGLAGSGRARERQDEPEAAAHPRLAFDADAPAVRLHEGLRERQAQPGAAVLARGAVLDLVKLPEQARQLLGGDPDA